MDGAVRFEGWRAVETSKTLSENGEPKWGRVYTMYHGTHIDNAESIIKNGFKPSENGTLGKGVYLNRNIKNAKCYPLRTDKRDQVVFKLKVNVGKVKKIDFKSHPLCKTWHSAGNDCAWVPPSSDPVNNSGEDCVWDPKRITIVDVACCVDEGKRRKLRNLIRSTVLNNNCSPCRHSSLELPHELLACWACGGMICPFEREHVCMTH